MKKIAALFTASLMLTFPACNKTDTDNCGRVTVTAPSTEVLTLQTYISSNSISAVGDERGFFYTIGRPGNDSKPTVCSTVKVAYTGRLTNGAQFDASGGLSLSLANLIAGWQEGLPLIGEGGSITLYLPPSLGYGAQASTKIPANSITIFQIDLIDVQ